MSSSSACAPAKAAAAVQAPAKSGTTTGQHQQSLWHTLLLALVMAAKDPAKTLRILDDVLSLKNDARLLEESGVLWLKDSSRMCMYRLAPNIPAAKAMILKGLSAFSFAISVPDPVTFCVAALLGDGLESLSIDATNGLVGANEQRPLRVNTTTANRDVVTTYKNVRGKWRVVVTAAHDVAVTSNGENVRISALLIFGPRAPASLSTSRLVQAPRNCSSVFLFPAVVRPDATKLPTTAKDSFRDAWDYCDSQHEPDQREPDLDLGPAFGPSDNNVGFVKFHVCLQLLKTALALFIGASTEAAQHPMNVDPVFAAYDGLLHNVSPSIMFSLFSAIQQEFVNPGKNFLFKHLSCGSAESAQSCFCSSSKCLQTLHCTMDDLEHGFSFSDCRETSGAAQRCGGRPQVMFGEGRLVYVSAEVPAEALIGGEWAYVLAVNGQVVGSGLVDATTNKKKKQKQ